MPAGKIHLASPTSLTGRLIVEAGRTWQGYVDHRFVRLLASGELPEASFRHYLVQDYLFLVHFSRAWALAAFKADDIEEIRACAAVLQALATEEMRLHVDYCRGFGLSEEAMAATAEAPGNMAYTRFVLERGLAGDLLDLLTALAPCVVGYGEIGAGLMADPATRLEGNPYAAWIEMYGGSDYRAVALSAIAQLDRVASRRIGGEPWRSPRWASLSRTFTDACRLEIGFWDMGLEPAA